MKPADLPAGQPTKTPAQMQRKSAGHEGLPQIQQQHKDQVSESALGCAEIESPGSTREDGYMTLVDQQWWTTTDVAEYLGVRVGTVSSYRQRGQMPAPDQTIGRTHMWAPTIIT